MRALRTQTHITLEVDGFFSFVCIFGFCFVPPCASHCASFLSISFLILIFLMSILLFFRIRSPRFDYDLHRFRFPRSAVCLMSHVKTNSSSDWIVRLLCFFIRDRMRSVSISIVCCISLFFVNYFPHRLLSPQIHLNFLIMMRVDALFLLAAFLSLR